MFGLSMLLSSGNDYGGGTLSSVNYGTGGTSTGYIGSSLTSGATISGTSAPYAPTTQPSYSTSSSDAYSAPSRTESVPGLYDELREPAKRFAGRFGEDYLSQSLRQFQQSECKTAWLAIGVLGLLVLTKKRR